MRLLPIIVLGSYVIHSFGLADESNSEFNYFLWETASDSQMLRSEITISPNSKQIISGGHSFTEAEFCSPDDEMVCVGSRHFSFAAPKTTLRPNDTWSFNHHNFRVISCDNKFQLLGVPFKNVCLLGSEDPREEGYETEWLYSQEKGLLGFTRIFEGRESPFWLVEQRGFGALE